MRLNPHHFFVVRNRTHKPPEIRQPTRLGDLLAFLGVFVVAGGIATFVGIVTAPTFGYLTFYALIVALPLTAIYCGPSASAKNNHLWTLILQRADAGQKRYRLLAAVGRALYGVKLVQKPNVLTDQNFHAVADKMAYMINDALGIPPYQGYALRRCGSLIIAEFTNPPPNLDGGTIVFQFPSKDLQLFRKGLSHQQIIDHYDILSTQMPTLSEVVNEHRHQRQGRPATP